MSVDETAENGDSDRFDFRETYRQQMLESFGGWQGTVITAIPTVVFVIVNAAAELRTAIIWAIGSAVVLAGYRLARRQSTQQALAGLFGVVVAALIAARTGEARGYFLIGIVANFGWAAVFTVSVLVRRPIVGLAWEFMEPTPGGADVPWYRRRVLLRAYDLATIMAIAVFVLRGGVQVFFYGQNATGMLAVTKIAMGFPLYLGALAFGFWIVTRARKRAIAELA